MEVFPTQKDGTKSRKKHVYPTQWRRNKEKKERYSSPGQPIIPKCKHNKKGKSYECNLLSNKDIQLFHNAFYNDANKITQDQFILKYTSGYTPLRQRGHGHRENKGITLKYYVLKQNNSKKMIQVCRETFLGILRISKNRVQGVSKRFLSSEGKMPKENRGGDKKSAAYRPKRESVIKFISKFPAVENHYCRNKTSERVYLRSDLSINKMWKIYQSETDDPSLRVKKTYFRKIFNTQFNIGFGTPRTDVCSTCISLNEMIKLETNPEKKQDLCVQKRVHTLKAQAFYKLLQEERCDLMTFSFDCQKNQVLPKVPDQSAYYSRQLYQYNLTVIAGSSKSKQTKDNTFIYEWKETEFPKGSNEISSAIFHCLSTYSFNENITHVRMVSDGCGARTKIQLRSDYSHTGLSNLHHPISKL